MLTLVNIALGLGIFLFGMHQLESSLRQLGSHKLRKIFTSGSTTAWQSVTLGIITTSLLQSSSMVTLMVQALSAAGLIPLVNGIGIILGANLGTTLTGWLVTLAGFKFSLDALAVPLLGGASLGLVFYNNSYRSHSLWTLLLGVGLLLFGLAEMKSAVDYLPSLIPIEQLQGFHPVVYLLVGTGLTAIIQSSSATMLIALTALNSGLLQLPAAAALIIGADLGTTSTSALASIRGSVSKKQLALAHFTFNIVVDLCAFFLLLPILPWLLNLLNLEDPLYSLVAFHSIFNLVGLCLFLPILKPFTHWIDSCFQAEKNQRYPKLTEITLQIPDAALETIRHTVHIQINDVLDLNQQTLALSGDAELLDEAFENRYEALKSVEGELLICNQAMQQMSLDADQISLLNRLIESSREAVFSAKSLRDIRRNLQRMRDGDFGHYREVYRDSLKNIYQQFHHLLNSEHQPGYAMECLERIGQENTRIHEQLHREIIKQELGDKLVSSDLSTLLNINREIWQANDRLYCAVKSFMIPVTEPLV